MPNTNKNSPTIGGTADNTKTGLDIPSLDTLVEQYFHAALAPNTICTYTSAKNRNLHFCTFSCIKPFPVNEHSLCLFAAQLAQDKVSHLSIKSYLSAIRHTQIALGLPDPSMASMPKLEGVIKGIKATQARSGSPKKKRLPITPSILNSMRLQWEKQGPSQDHIMLWAAVTYTLSFFGFLRSGEVTVPSDSAFNPSAHLTFEDVSVDQITEPQVLKVHLKTSKTDPFRKGVNVFLENCKAGVPLPIYRRSLTN